MSETQSPKQTGRSVVALLASFAAVIILSLGTDVLLHATGIYPPWGQPMSERLFTLATAYRVAYGVLGGYIVARFAPNRPMGHALLSGLIGVVLSTIGAVATWDKGPEFGPKWYPLALIATALPCAWVGGKLHEIQTRGRPVPTRGI
ncbi:MAG: hypothetical protein IPP47_11810 [Bryobacterales bacterium]|nr:hypothetical protein [Bryobacterales bacterium]